VKFVLPLLLVLAATGAFAEDAPSKPTPAPAPASTAPAAPAKYYLELEQADLDAVARALQELPKRMADPLILKLNGQLQAQEQLKAAANKALDADIEKAKKGRK
jgi:hypothetical protein